MMLAAVVLAVPAWSQDGGESSSEPAGGTAMGVKGYFGFGSPSYEASGTIESETGTAWALALFYNWSTKGIISFGVQPELHYVSESGAKLGVSDDNNIKYDITTHVNALRLPILLKLQFLDPHIVQPSIYVGPSFSYVLSAYNNVNGEDIDIDGTGFQMGFAAGVDVTILSFLVVDVRYNTKFADLTYNLGEDWDNLGEVAVTMSSIKFGLGVRF